MPLAGGGFNQFSYGIFLDHSLRLKRQSFRIIYALSLCTLGGPPPSNSDYEK